MAAPHRTVRQLRLRAPAPADVRRAARHLEDALRCASLPDSGGRLLLVRRLDLGRLRADITSQGLALLLERRVQECGYSWVHGHEPRAASANAVWFRDAGEALIVLALQVLERTPALTAWFWPHVLPGFSPGCTTVQTLESIVAHCVEQPAGIVIIPELLGALARRLSAEALLALFTPAAQRMLDAVARRVAIPARAQQSQPTARSARVAWHAPHGEVLRVSHDMQAQAPWLPVLLAAARWTPTSSLPALAPTAASPVLTAVAPAWLEAVAGTVPSLLENATSIATPTVAAAQPHTSPAAASAPPATSLTTASLSASPARSAQMLHTPELASFGELYASQAAGILFLVPLLQRLGFAAWSEVLPALQATAIAGGVLQQALRRLRVAVDDPAHTMLADWPALPMTCEAVATPPVWRDPRIQLHLPAAADSAQLAALWLTACRRSLRRAARIGLASLVLRAGALAWSTTHLDAHFDVRAAELRVRRNALDIDPGWVPWLGRIVSFHYHPGLMP